MLLGTVSTNYTYDMLNHLIQVSMPRGSNTQTRTFNYITGSTVGINLLSATNPENGTVTYTYNSDNTLHTKTDAKGQVFTYSYDSYKRLTQVEVGSTVLRSFMYDTNTLDSTFGVVHARAPGGRAESDIHSAGVRAWPRRQQHQRSQLDAIYRDVRLHAGGPDLRQAAAGAGDVQVVCEQQPGDEYADAQHGRDLYVQ
jgi:YD repeat-containing protein